MSLPFTTADPLTAARQQMVQAQMRSRGIRDERVLAAFERVPRHLFLPATKQSEAYEDHPMMIGEGQTISQPYMNAAMLEAAEIQPSDVVLEIGTGSGYQTAALAELAAKVYSIERFASLMESARNVLEKLNYRNVTVVVGDGTAGLPESAPFDAIIVSAAAPHVPPALVAQLRDGGRLVIPVGNRDEQMLHRIRKLEGGLQDQSLFGCKFVPLIGEFGFLRS